ncbi:MAG TPA: SAM-dependent chlorinase/fluorinase [Pyrinomonadaceae bacterium]|nr:SAM-dependent chlorinase/fluorinase [Pyrinomonadaceae bacterium]
MRAITLLTDFGTADYFVGAMKGAILSINPRAVIADITHEIPAQDVAAGAWQLLAAYDTFPAGTIHVAVVDPGVGSTRRPIVVRAGEHLFVGPDNGIFTYIYNSHPSFQAFNVTETKYFRHPVSNTFHGRDIFAPVAAALSTGVDPSSLGPRISDPVRLSTPPGPHIIHIDRFGNLITNIARNQFTEGSRLSVNGRVISAFRKYFGENVGDRDEPFAIWGSAGLLEIAVNGGSAAEILGVKRGFTPIEIQIHTD